MMINKVQKSKVEMRKGAGVIGASFFNNPLDEEDRLGCQKEALYSQIQAFFETFCSFYLGTKSC